MAYYGPTVPHDAPDHDAYSTPAYLTGYANKIRADLKRVANLYNGTRVYIFTLNEDASPCPNCVDQFTGQVVLADCPECDGTGKVRSYVYVGEYAVVAQVSPKTKTATELGDSEVSQQNTFEVIDAPLLEDQDLLVTKDTQRIYKIVDTDPSIVAIGGEVIAQFVSCTAISKGSPEYRVLTYIDDEASLINSLALEGLNLILDQEVDT